MSIAAVLFDYGLVLTGAPDPAAWQRMQSILHAAEPAFDAAYWSQRHEYDRGTLTSSAYWNDVARRLGRTLTPDDLAALHEADIHLWTVPNQPMIDWAQSLQRRGIRTGILSNIGDAMEDGIRSRHAWLADFNHHTFSHRVGLIKPDPAIYRHAAAGLGVPPSSVLFIDDRAENIDAARAAGMTAIQYTTHAAFLTAMHHLGLDDLLHPAP